MKKEDEKPKAATEDKLPLVITSLNNGGVFRVDLGESPTPVPLKTATDNE